MALGGTLLKKQGMAVNIRGNLAVKTLDPETLLKGGGDVNIAYDSRLDPTIGTSSAYGCYLSPERSYCQE